MKNFNILDVHCGSSKKTYIEAELPKKGGFGQFEDLRRGGGVGGLARKKGVMFLMGVFTPMHTKLKPKTQHTRYLDMLYINITSKILPAKQSLCLSQSWQITSKTQRIFPQSLLIIFVARKLHCARQSTFASLNYQKLYCGSIDQPLLPIVINRN